jgi:hypothetical protein
VTDSSATLCLLSTSSVCIFVCSWVCEQVGLCVCVCMCVCVCAGGGLRCIRQDQEVDEKPLIIGTERERQDRREE